MRAFVVGDRAANPLYEQIAQHFGYSDGAAARTGKRLRPRLVFAAAEAFGGVRRAALAPAIAIELLHNYSLIHDDIEDHDRLRHGRPALWVTFGEAHGINAGDAVGALAHAALAPVAQDNGNAVAFAMSAELSAANLAMCEGQALDLALEGGAAASVARYVEMVDGKTAALFGCAAALGALAAGAPAAGVERARAIGRAFGRGFQIDDDVLGIWGDPAHTGKVEANDIARRKSTYPIAWAIEHDPSGAGALLLHAYGSSRVGDDEVRSIRDALERGGARDAATRAAAEHFAAADALCAGAPPLRAFVERWRQRA